MPIVPEVDVYCPCGLCQEHEYVDSQTDRDNERTYRGVICHGSGRRPSHVKDLELQTIDLDHLAQCRADGAGKQRCDYRKAHKADSYQESALEGLAEFDTDADAEDGEDDRHHHRGAQTDDITEYLFHNYLGCFPI